MFTGIIRHCGRIAGRSNSQIELDCPELRPQIAPGDSVNVSGACLTAARLSPTGFIADLLPETRDRTTLGKLSKGAAVNLELALAAGERFGGHFIQGHIDGISECLDVLRRADGTMVLEFQTPDWLRRWLVPRGSIAVDGVSLTIQDLKDASFTVAVIPATARETALGNIIRSARVNIEADMLVKTVCSILESSPGGRPSLDSEVLKNYGYGE